MFINLRTLAVIAFLGITACSGTLPSNEQVPIPPENAKLNKVIVLGMIHGRHETSERYSTQRVKGIIKAIAPDYVLTEIPPDRLAEAMKGFIETGEVTETRTRVFPEYKDVLFPLSREMDFKIIPTAAWSRGMADFRREALGRIREDGQSDPRAFSGLCHRLCQ